MRKIQCQSTQFRFPAATILLLLLSQTTRATDDTWTPLGTDDNFAAWHQSGDWYVAGDATLNPDQSRLLVGKPGTGVMINGKSGKTQSLVTRQTFQDVEVHLEFMVAKGSNSGVIFHGNHEIQILDSHGIENPNAGHCGGVYPRAENEPTYHHIDKGSPPRVNAAKPPGQWQTLDIIFQAARFDKAGDKTAHAKFGKVVHNGQVIQEDVEMPYAHGPNWDRKQYPRGPIIFQGDYGPIALRNIRVRPWNVGDKGTHARQAGSQPSKLNVPPPSFTALFNGKDFTGWRVHPKVKEMWSIEDGVLKSHGLLEEWGADLVTEREYQDYVLMVDFRMPALSDSGIHFRNLAPAMLGKMGDAEQFNIRSKGGMGQLESFHFVPESMKLTEDQFPQVEYVDPEIGVWHTIKLTVVGKTITAQLDREVILDEFEYPEGMLATGPNAIRFQKHRFTEGGKPGARNPCPIEFRNIFIKEIEPSEPVEPRGLNVPPPGFTALFNGKDLTGWHTRPEVSENWFVENGLLKSTSLVEHYRASLVSKKQYRDFILMLEFRMPTISDSGICFRRLIPEIPGFGTMEQFNLRSRGGMGHLESYYFLPKETAEKVGLKEEEKPHVRHIDPEVGVWHKVKLTMKGRTFSAEYDGEVLHDNYQFHDWMMNLEPAPILLQKHMVVRGDNLGAENPCPIEYRNVFIKELGPGDAIPPSPSRSGATAKRMPDLPNAGLLARIDARNLPEGYEPAKHQDYVDQHWPELSPVQVGRALQLWKVKQEIDPDMPNRGFSFVRILAYVAEGETPIAEAAPKRKSPPVPALKPVNQWTWSAEIDEERANRKAIPVKISDEHTIYVAPFDTSEDNKSPAVLQPESRLRVRGRIATAAPVLFGITIQHPNGDSAGRFLTERPADDFPGGEDFEVTVDFQNFHLDPTLDEMKDQLPDSPSHFVVESIWLTTLEKQAGLEVAQVELIPPAKDDVPAAPRARTSEVPRPSAAPIPELLSRIDKSNLPEEYVPAKHQEYVDRRMATLSEEQQGKIGQLWKEKERLDPNMANRGHSFVKILEYVAAGDKAPETP
jgi:3-keto-disaccharide hydrolase